MFARPNASTAMPSLGSDDAIPFIIIQMALKTASAKRPDIGQRTAMTCAPRSKPEVKLASHFLQVYSRPL